MQRINSTYKSMYNSMVLVWLSATTQEALSDQH